MSQETDHPKAGARSSLEEGIAEWRSYVRRRQAIHSVDVDELEDHLRSQASALEEAGLTEDEAFLIAVKRIGDLDALSREFAREHSERLWKRLVVAPDAAGERRGRRQGSPGGGRPGGRRRRGHQGPGAVRREDAAGPGAAGVLSPQLQPLRAPVPGRVLRLEAVPRAGGPAVAGGAVRGRGRGDQPHAVRTRRAAPRSWRRCTCPSRCGWPWASRTPPAAGAITTSA